MKDLTVSLGDLVIILSWPTEAELLVRFQPIESSIPIMR